MGGESMKPALERMWETFLLVKAAEEVQPPESALAQAVMGHVRHDILPLVRRLEVLGIIDWYSFLLHGPPPGASKPDSLYLHLRVSVKPADEPTPWPAGHGDKLRQVLLDGGWECTRPIVAPDCREIAGLGRANFVDGDIERAWHLIGEQAAWYLMLVEQHDPKVSDLDLLYHVCQFFHYFSNMAVLPDRVPDWFQQRHIRHVYWKRLWIALRSLWAALRGKRLQ